MSEVFVKAIIDGIQPFPGIALDIGAHVGDYTEILAQKFEKVYAFEPLPENIIKLEERFKDNPKVIIVPKAVSNKNGYKRFYLNDKPSEGTLSENYPQIGVWDYALTNYIEVETVTLDTFCEGIPIVFMKVDVEGAEQFMFRGAVQTLAKNAAWILIETHHMVDYEYLMDLFKCVGYKEFVTHSEEGLIQTVDFLWPGLHYLIHKGDAKLDQQNGEN